MKNLTKENGSKFYNLEKIRESLKTNKIYIDENIQIRLHTSIIKENSKYESSVLTSREEIINYLVEDSFFEFLSQKGEITKEESNKKIQTTYKKIMTSSSIKVLDLDNDSKLKRFLNKAYIFLILKNKKTTNKKNKLGKDKDAHLFETNETAFFFLTKENTDKFLVGKNLEIKKDIVKSFKKIGFNSLEIPNCFDEVELLDFLKSILKVKENFKLNDLNMTLRIKKFALKYSYEGVYNKLLKTVVLDARHRDVFFHELGHYIFENQLNYFYDNKVFSFEEYSINLNLSGSELDAYRKIKHYSEKMESEAFALNFEAFALISLIS